MSAGSDTSKKFRFRLAATFLLLGLTVVLRGQEQIDDESYFKQATARAEAAFNAGQYQEALKELRGILERKPGDGLTLRRMGVACLARGDVFEAIRFLERAAVALPSDPLCWGYLGIAAGRAGDLLVAHDYLVRACGLDPKNLDFRGKLVETLCDLKEWDLALAQVETGIRTEGSGAEWENLRAACAMEAGKWEYAAERLARMWTLPGTREERAATGRSYARVLIWMGRYKEASDVLERCGSPAVEEDPIYLSNLVRAKALSGETEEARSFLFSHLEQIGYPWAEIWSEAFSDGKTPPVWVFDPAGFCPQNDIGKSWLLPEMLQVGIAQELVIELDRQQGFPLIDGLLEDAEAFLHDALGLPVTWLRGEVLPQRSMPEDPAVLFASSMDGLSAVRPGSAYMRLVLFDSTIPGPSFVDSPFPSVFLNASEWSGQAPWARAEKIMSVRLRHLLGHAIGLDACEAADQVQACIMKPAAWVRFSAEEAGLCATCRDALRRRLSADNGGIAPSARRFRATSESIVRQSPDYSAEFFPHKVLLRASPGSELASLSDPEPEMRMISIQILQDLAGNDNGLSTEQRFDQGAFLAALENMAASDPDERVRLLAAEAAKTVGAINEQPQGVP
jgi:tetratricopeptide (TPR) repeat protein